MSLVNTGAASDLIRGKVGNINTKFNYDSSVGLYENRTELLFIVVIQNLLKKFQFKLHIADGENAQRKPG